MKFIFIFFVLAISAFSDQFGLTMGMKLEQIDKSAKKIANGVYQVKVPKPHNAFVRYIVRICPSEGLYYIKAMSDKIETNGHGTSLQMKFEEIENKLKNVYGDNKKTDFLVRDSLWDEPKYWMMGLLKQDRYYFSVWHKESNAKLKENLMSIGLSSVALSTQTGYIALEYTYENEKKCEEELAKKEDGVL